MTAREKKIYQQLAALYSELAKLPEEEPVKAPEPERHREEEYLPAAEFCERFRISRSTLWRMTQAGRVQVLDLGGRSRRYRPCEGVKS